MRFSALLATTAVAVTSVRGVPTANAVESRDLSLSLNLGGLFNGMDLSNTNHYGAPIPPWAPGHKPGWYYGPHPGDHPDLPCLGGVRLIAYIEAFPLTHFQLICKILDLIPFIIHCPHEFPPPPPPPTYPPSPPPSDGYTPTFTNITAAVQADDFLTFGLVETVADCKAMCNSVDGCGFVNSESNSLKCRF
jgi:hypothetical protein